MKINFRTFTSVLLFGTLISVIVGVTFYGMNIFNVKSPIFQFVSYGFIGSLTFGLLKAQKYFMSVIIHPLLFTGLFFLTGGQFLVSHIFYYFAILISLFIFSILIFDHLATAKYLRPIILATMLSIFFVSDTFLLSLIYTTPVTSALIFRNMLIGLLIGLGVGIGIETGELLVNKENRE
jgi:hypothetical protein